jgi:hypothetical protein
MAKKRQAQKVRMGKHKFTPDPLSDDLRGRGKNPVEEFWELSDLHADDIWLRETAERVAKLSEISHVLSDTERWMVQTLERLLGESHSGRGLMRAVLSLDSNDDPVNVYFSKIASLALAYNKSIKEAGTK